MSKMIEGRIECPFYVKEGEGFIACEGLIAHTVCKHSFRSNDLKNNYEENICSSSGGRKCQHYRNLSLLYERGMRG